MKRIVFTLIFTLFSLVGFAQQAYEVQHFAHRGSRHEFDENTLSAFQGTYDKGIRGYETDIRMTKDGELIINHDASLKRTAGVDMIVEQHTRKELQKVKASRAPLYSSWMSFASGFRSEMAYTWSLR